MSKPKPFVFGFIHGNHKIFVLIFVTGLIVTLLRIFGTFLIEWDQGIQVEASQRLIQGLGLTSTYFEVPFSSKDIAQTQNFNISSLPNIPYLTWYPPGFSLILASLLFLGLPLSLSLKLIYGIATVLGWLGWAKLGSYFLRKPIRIGKISLPTHFLIAGLLPLFYTPWWNGTDIFLWCGVPFIAIFLCKSLARGLSVKSYLIASGLISGLLYSIRYSSLFLIAAAFLFLLCTNYRSIKDFLKRYSIFCFCALIPILPVFIYSKTVAGTSGLPEYISLGRTFSNLFTISSLLEIANKIIATSATLATICVFQVDAFSVLLIKDLSSHSLASFIWGSCGLVFVFVLPLIIANIPSREQFAYLKLEKYFALFLSLALVSLSILLIASTFSFPSYNFFGDKRYYVAIGPSCIFIFYDLSTRLEVVRHSFWCSLGRLFFSSLVIVFLIYNLFYKPNFIISKGNQLYLVQAVLGAAYREQTPYPSNQVSSYYKDTLTKLIDLQKENPTALFFVQDHPNFAYSGYHFRPIYEQEIWEKAYVDKAVKIFWTVNNSCSKEICSTIRRESVKQLSSQPTLRTVFTFPHENTRILVSDVPSEYNFSN